MDNKPTYCSGFGKSTVCIRRHQCQRFQDGKTLSGIEPERIMHKPPYGECAAYKPVTSITKRS